VTVGRYVLYGALASGGMATIHLGRMLGPRGFARTVAVKRLHEQFAHDATFVADLLDEARISARVVHPNVVPTLDVVATEKELLLVMEYVHGESLSRLLRAAVAGNMRVPVNVAITVMASALHGLHAAHDATDEAGAPLNVVHRDISPQNIMVGADGVTRVLDFGIAKAAGRLQNTMTGQLKGKLSYMAPEQVSSKPVDRRTDIFAASIVLWELLTSTRLFAGDSEASTIGNLLHRPIEPPSKRAPDVPRALDELVLKGLSREPAARHQTAKDMAALLENAVTPATTTQTSEWVARLAGDVLADRAKRVREIESATPVAHADGSSVLEVQDLATLSPVRDIADIAIRHLAGFLGPHTARVAVKTFAMKALKRSQNLKPEDVPALNAALRPMLRTFIGRAECERVLAEIEKEAK